MSLSSSSLKTRPTTAALTQYNNQNRVLPEEYYDYDYNEYDYSKKVKNKQRGESAKFTKNRSSGYGSDSYGGDVGYGGGGGHSECETGVSIGLLLTAALGIGVMLFTLFTKITMGRRRRRREIDEYTDMIPDFLPIVMSGLEDLEERVDKLVVGQNDETSWISSLYNKFKGTVSNNDTDSSDEDGLEGLEPPNLDETWGLADTNLFDEEDSNQNSTLTESGEHSRNPRSVDEEVYETENELDDNNGIVQNLDLIEGFFTDKDSCKFKLYKCIAGVVEGGYHHAKKSGGIYNYAQKVFFKIAFNKGFGGGAWNAVMSAPEARKVQRCFNAQNDCLTHNILLNEVNDPSMDPESKGSQKRLLINTEYVENLDKSNGSTPYDPDNEPDYDE
ncbi:uncharacterized protein [Lepeophtheirus salmonis]|uniref:Uncharacterized protein n=1 Tax=Lepeophtheirus salmonis TaxID=72036 RepID=A0A0K2VJZ1_LEPSM|nr:uncharacterized protein LOC121120292 isoform X2 [Lepeophtheirus salmonis]XP_040571076.1 uncharacterized protein LOC121120292 isoform X2 [Lepeophtheirus salmonis]XP_040571077.1 uncharacterized protein LOC121120292 isoform X2 [Lepeophtheirus salmonis]